MLGLSTYISDDPLAKAIEIAETIADRNPYAIRAAKRLSNAMYDQTGEEMLMRESVEQEAIMRTPNQIEAVMAGMTKRKANFEDVA